MDEITTNSEIIDTQWIEKLAMDELSMDESGVIQFNDHLNPTHSLEESSIALVDEIREKLNAYVTVFNQHRGNSTETGKQIKIFKIANTVNDFMLFRNSLKLVIARREVDKVAIGFLSNSGGLFSARLHNQTQAHNMAHEITGTVGSFNNVVWTFNGEKLDVDAMVKHYFTEFVKHSAR